MSDSPEHSRQQGKARGHGGYTPRNRRDDSSHGGNLAHKKPHGSGQQGGNKYHQHKAKFQQPKTPIPQGRAFVPVGEPEELTGILEITGKGFGFIRTADTGWAPSTEAVYVPADLIAQHHLRPFVQVTGMAQRYERGHQLISVLSVNGITPEEAAAAPHFEDLKAVNPSHRLAFETVPSRFTTRTLDLMAPVARGQRGLIVAPPRTGKTTLLMHIAEGAQENYGEDLHLMILLVDERPEEVTEFKRTLPGAEIFASSNDSGVREHCRIAEMCIERAKRLVEQGRHVLILMDSITRLARAYNNADRGSGRTMSGGIDARALETPRRLFAAARNTRTAGSLTILATALVETNSRMDELIFQEFKGTGNMELVLNRRIAEMYIYPAVDILKSGTRREELILSELAIEKIRLIRRGLANYKPTEAMERLLFFLRKCPNNAQLLLDIKSRNS
ncbi:MAG: transcription termination factor Rho [Akkermansia sp.]|nr:transcription termination factor Rho [Akkermansia sp.]